MCLPGGQRAAQAPAEADDRQPADLYFDVSGSMLFYGRAASDARSRVVPFRNLIAAMLAEGGGSPRLYGFANHVAKISRSQAEALADGRAAGCAACGHSESHLDELLAQIAHEPPSAISVVVTDLWFTNREIIDNGAVSLDNPIRAILGSGRAIGVLGFVAHYSGPVYDMPDGPPYAGPVQTRPLFVLIIGRPLAVARVNSRLQERMFFDNEGVERHFSMFSAGIPGAAGYRVEFHADEKKAVLIDDAVLADLGVEREIPQYDLDIGEVARQKPDNGGPVIGASGVFDPRSRLPEGIVWRGPVNVSTTLWVMVDDPAKTKCHHSGWDKLSNGGGILRLTGGVYGTRRMEIDAASPEFDSIASGDTVLLRYDIRLRDLPVDNADTKWLEGWSFDWRQVREVRQSAPTLFPTLNLAAFRSLLERAVADEVTDACRSGHGCPLLASGAIAFRIQ